MKGLCEMTKTSLLRNKRDLRIRSVLATIRRREAVPPHCLNAAMSGWKWGREGACTPLEIGSRSLQTRSSATTGVRKARDPLTPQKAQRPP